MSDPQGGRLDPVWENSNSSSVLAATSLSYTITVGANNNRIVAVFVRIGSDSDLVTSVTCAGVNPSQVLKFTGNGPPYHNFYLYLFVAPATGTDTITITTSAATDIFSSALSAYNALQGNFDNTQSGLVSNGQTFILTSNSLTDRCALGMFIWNTTSVPTAGNNVTLASSFTNGNSGTASAWVDNTVITPPSSIFPSVTTTAPTSFAGVTFTIAPTHVAILQTSTITDRLVRTKPTAVALGPEGFTYNDPAFGTWIARITDGNTIQAGLNQSWNVNATGSQHGWSSDSKKFYVQRTDGSFYAASFNPTTLTWQWGSQIGLYNDLSFDCAINPNYLYGSLTSAVNHHTVGRVDVTNINAQVNITLFDAATVINGILGPGTFPTGDTFLNTIMCQQTKLIVLCGGTGQDHHFFALLYDLVTPSNSIVINTLTRPELQNKSGVTGLHVHSLSLDLTGRWVLITPALADNAQFPEYVWDTQTNTITGFQTSAGGHMETGANGECVNQDTFSGTYDGLQYVYRQLTAVNGTLRNVMTPQWPVQEVYIADHASPNDAVPGQPYVFTSSNYRYNDANSQPPYTYTSTTPNTTPWRAGDSEIIRIDTTPLPTTAWRRICHHRSLVDQQPQTDTGAFFLNQPVLNISPDGRWVLFHTNYDATLGTDSRDGRWRHDVFMAYLGLGNTVIVTPMQPICFGTLM